MNRFPYLIWMIQPYHSFNSPHLLLVRLFGNVSAVASYFSVFRYVSGGNILEIGRSPEDHWFCLRLVILSMLQETKKEKKKTNL